MSVATEEEKTWFDGEHLQKGILLCSKPKAVNNRTALWELRHHYCFPFLAYGG